MFSSKENIPRCHTYKQIIKTITDTIHKNR
jgi:aerobic-type carbon monoxide dehydrogenase small subunit (CoxS/CutS family)